MFGMDYNQDGFDMDEDFGWEGSSLSKFDRNDRYGNAYGNYRGGYPPSGMPGPPHGFPGQFGPPRPLMDSIPPLGWGGGQFFQRPPMLRPTMEDKVARYLMRCGVSKESIKNLPRQLLQMIEPEYCGLCSQQFESFPDSRMHYVSKIHMKNQRKWLSKHSDGGHRPKEIPLKSRDLYCELCDIHITSKQHADSHYDGKAHRAIVEGRREPRNKSLTLRNMQPRLQQLLRRERKFVKPLEEHQKAVCAKPKESKDVPPELYCNICKTAVTCSEQMTMHLNGKRHLAKEKSHILRMMKGEVADSGEKNAESAAETVEGKNDDAEPTAENEEGNTMEVNKDGEESGNKDKDDFDWGKDSESWDETPTKED